MKCVVLCGKFCHPVFLKLLKHTHLLRNATCLFPIQLNFFNIGISFLTFQEPTFRIVSCMFSPGIVFGIPFSKSQVTTEAANYILFTLKDKQKYGENLVVYLFGVFLKEQLKYEASRHAMSLSTFYAPDTSSSVTLS